jgi:hypothetical protein
METKFPTIYIKDYNDEFEEQSLTLRLEVEQTDNAAWFNIYLPTGEKITAVGVDYYDNKLQAVIDHLHDDEADVIPIVDDVLGYQPPEEDYGIL